MAGTQVYSLSLLLAGLLMIVFGTESAVIVVGGERGWTTGFDYDAWATSQNLQPRVGDSLVFVNFDQVAHTVALVETADAYQRCTLGGGSTIHPIPSGRNYSMIIPANLESKTLYAVCTVPGHCTEGQKMKTTVRAGLQASSPPPAANTSDGDLNRYICWTTAVLLIAACFWKSN